MDDGWAGYLRRETVAVTCQVDWLYVLVEAGAGHSPQHRADRAGVGVGQE